MRLKQSLKEPVGCARQKAKGAVSRWSKFCMTCSITQAFKFIKSLTNFLIWSVLPREEKYKLS